MDAWGDESNHRAVDAETSHYALAVAVIEPSQVESVREAMREVTLPGSKKNHFRSNSAKQNERVVDLITELPLGGVIVAHQGTSVRPERQRRLCLESLFPHLEAVGVEDLTWESRGPADDRRDREMLRALRQRRVIAGSLKLSHRPGPADPILWIADTLCGAFTQALVRDEDRLWTRISRKLQVDWIQRPG